MKTKKEFHGNHDHEVTSDLFTVLFYVTGCFTPILKTAGQTIQHSKQL